ncbi:MAG: MFS transporter [Thermoplasmata archaeon]
MILSFKKYRFNSDLLSLIMSSILPSISMGYNIIIFPLYLYFLGMSPAVIGILFSLQMVIAGALMIPFGRLADKYGKWYFIVLSTMIPIFTTYVYISTVNTSIIFIAYLFQALSYASSSGSMSALMAEKTTRANRDYAFSFMSFGTAFGSMAGSLVAVLPSYLSSHGWSIVDSYKPLFFITIILEFLSLSFILLKVSPDKGSKKMREARKSFWPEKSRKVVTRFSVLSLIGLGAGIIVQLFSLWFYLRFHVGGSFLGPLFAVSNLFVAVAFLISPLVVEKIGPVKTIVYTQWSSVVLLLLIPVIPSILIVSVLYVSRNLLMNMSGPIQNSFLMSLVSPDERASASSITNSFHTIPRAFGPAIGGYLLNIGNLTLPFFLTGILYAVSSTLFLIFFKGYEKKNHKKDFKRKIT